MTPRFLNFCTGFVLPWECDWPSDKTGQLTDDPKDPGGLTRWGIDKRSHPDVNVADLTYQDALALYWQEWKTEGCENATAKIGEAFYDACVNCGLSRAKAFLQGASSYSDVIDARDAFYRRLVRAKPSLSKFLKGWLNRTADLQKYLT